MRAQDIMTRTVSTVRPATKLAELANKLVAEHVSGMPVVDDEGKLVGVVEADHVIAFLRDKI